jgi:hypothetical protein
MKKWLFSNNGEITDTLTLAEAQSYVDKHKDENDDIYVWHPSFTHWTPLSQVDDFEIEVIVPAPPVELPKALIEEYKNKEVALFKTLTRIDNTLGNSRAALSELDHEIDTYTKYTDKLNTEVKTTLKNVNEQYEALQKSISSLTKNELVY